MDDPVGDRHVPEHGVVEFEVAQHRLEAAIRPVVGEFDTWHVERLFAEEVGPVMSPELVSAFDDADYIALGSKTRPHAWSDWLSTHPAHHRPREIRYYDHHFLMLEAALAGLGVALSPRVLAADDLSRSRLVAPAGFDPDGSSYGLVWPAGRELQDKSGPFVQWLKTEFSTSFS